MISKSSSFMVPLILLVFASQWVLPAENYCNDPNSWKEWDELVQKYPEDLDIQALHALRIGLCAKVERGDLTVDQATEIFERAREAIVDRKKAEWGSKRETFNV